MDRPDAASLGVVASPTRRFLTKTTFYRCVLFGFGILAAIGYLTDKDGWRWFLLGMLPVAVCSGDLTTRRLMEMVKLLRGR